MFLGEIEASKIGMLKMVMDNSIFHPFQLKVKNIGNFERDKGAIYWVGIERNENLLMLQNKLCRDLSSNEFKVEQRKFTPHLTLGREVIVNPPFDKSLIKIPEISFLVDKISLMKSERLNGRLVYTEIYKKMGL